LLAFSTPLPSTSTAWGTGDGLSIVIVTLPGFAASVFLSNFSAPLGSAVSFRSCAAPPPAVGVDSVVSVVLSWELDDPLPEEPLSLLSSPPQPAATSARPARTAARIMRCLRMTGCTQVRLARFA
jgi:hypothetical protein